MTDVANIFTALGNIMMIDMNLWGFHFNFAQLIVYLVIGTVLWRIILWILS